MNVIEYYAGEEKYVELVVKPINRNEIVVVTKAEYELTKYCDNTVIEKGQCELDGDRVIVLLGITESGRYELKFTVTVGRETRIEKARIEVNS